MRDKYALVFFGVGIRFFITCAVHRAGCRRIFGMIKHWMGSTHFLTRGIQNVSTEMSLNVLAYNFKRVLSILGFERTKKAM